MIDCTNQKVRRKPNPDFKPDFKVGPGKVRLSDQVRRRIEQLGVGENAVALWATMRETDKVSRQIGEVCS